MKYTSKLILNGTEYEFSAVGGWQPGANTILYLPLNGDTNDTSLSPKTVTNNGNAGYTTLTSGLKVLNLTGSQYLSTHFDIGTTFTINYYLYLSGTGVQMLWSYGPDSNLGLYYAHGGLENWGMGTVAMTGYTLNSWNMLTTVNSGNDRTLYINGIYINNSSIPIDYSSGQDFYVGSHGNRFNTIGLYSDFIIENKARTAQEVSDYFNQTKSLYGIS